MTGRDRAMAVQRPLVLKLHGMGQLTSSRFLIRLSEDETRERWKSRNAKKLHCPAAVAGNDLDIFALASTQ